jgi:hypothetical protein
LDWFLNKIRKKVSKQGKIIIFPVKNFCMKFSQLLFFSLFPSSLFSQIAPNAQLLTNYWEAKWISHPQASMTDSTHKCNFYK